MCLRNVVFSLAHAVQLFGVFSEIHIRHIQQTHIHTHTHVQQTVIYVHTIKERTCKVHTFWKKKHINDYEILIQQQQQTNKSFLSEKYGE